MLFVHGPLGLRMDAFDHAWALLKMPIVDTTAGVPVAYGEDVLGDERMRDSVGGAPFAYGQKDGPVDMTPNEYFDRLNVRQPYSWQQGVGYRWTPRSKSKEHIASMVEALQAGKVMGAPQLWFGRGEEEPWSQEGGHRMEALRQMGHGDTPIPVWHRYTS